jgi:hypothetical protein
MNYPLGCPKCGGKVPYESGVTNNRGITILLCSGCGARLRSLGEERTFPGEILSVVAVSVVLSIFPIWLGIAIVILLGIPYFRWALALEEVQD